MKVLADFPPPGSQAATFCCVLSAHVAFAHPGETVLSSSLNKDAHPGPGPCLYDLI